MEARPALLRGVDRRIFDNAAPVPAPNLRALGLDPGSTYGASFPSSVIDIGTSRSFDATLRDARARANALTYRSQEPLARSAADGERDPNQHERDQGRNKRHAPLVRDQVRNYGRGGGHDDRRGCRHLRSWCSHDTILPQVTHTCVRCAKCGPRLG